MRRLGGEEILAGAPGERLEEVAVDGDGPERRVVRLEGDRERVGHPRVAGAEDDEEVGIRALEHLPIRPARKSGPPRWKSMCGAISAETAGPPTARAPGPSAGEEAVDLRAQRRRLPRVGAARVGRRPHRALPEGVLGRAGAAPGSAALSRNPASSRLGRPAPAICSTVGASPWRAAGSSLDLPPPSARRRRARPGRGAGSGSTAICR